MEVTSFYGDQPLGQGEGGMGLDRLRLSESSCTPSGTGSSGARSQCFHRRAFPGGQGHPTGLGAGKGIWSQTAADSLVTLASHFSMGPTPSSEGDTGPGVCRDAPSGGPPGCLPGAPRSEHMLLFSTVHFTAKESGDLSTLFDVGGIAGEAMPCSASRLHPPLLLSGCRKMGRVQWDVT